MLQDSDMFHDTAADISVKKWSNRINQSIDSKTTFALYFYGFCFPYFFISFLSNHSIWLRSFQFCTRTAIKFNVKLKTSFLIDSKLLIELKWNGNETERSVKWNFRNNSIYQNVPNFSFDPVSCLWIEKSLAKHLQKSLFVIDNVSTLVFTTHRSKRFNYQFLIYTAKIGSKFLAFLVTVDVTLCKNWIWIKNMNMFF